MSDKESAQDVIEAYRRRQKSAKRTPIFIGLAILLLVIGAALIAYYFLDGASVPAIPFLATDTPTPTSTFTPTATFTPTSTATVTPTHTNTPTVTHTATPSGPFVYQVEEGDSLWAIAEQFGVDLLLVIKLNDLDPQNPNIQVGDRLTIPGPDTELPTATPLPTNLPRGTRIEYEIQLGDSLGSIAVQFNSTVDDIKEENEIENENEIFVGQVIIVPVNLVTPVPTNTPGTVTPSVTPTP
jgi:LysM repeat protein